MQKLIVLRNIELKIQHSSFFKSQIAGKPNQIVFHVEVKSFNKIQIDKSVILEDNFRRLAISASAAI